VCVCAEECSDTAADKSVLLLRSQWKRQSELETVLH